MSLACTCRAPVTRVSHASDSYVASELYCITVADRIFLQTACHTGASKRAPGTHACLHLPTHDMYHVGVTQGHWGSCMTINGDILQANPNHGLTAPAWFHLTYRKFTDLNRGHGILAWCVLLTVYHGVFVTPLVRVSPIIFVQAKWLSSCGFIRQLSITALVSALWGLPVNLSAMPLFLCHQHWAQTPVHGSRRRMLYGPIKTCVCGKRTTTKAIQDSYCSLLTSLDCSFCQRSIYILTKRPERMKCKWLAYLILIPARGTRAVGSGITILER